MTDLTIEHGVASGDPLARAGEVRQSGWPVQRRVIGALLLRELITRYGRHNIGFFWLFVEPMLFTVGVMTLWATIGLSHSGFPIAAFAITGYSSILLWRNMPSRCQGAIETNLQLMYHRNVKVIDLFYARLLLEAMGATVSFIVLTALFWAAGFLALPEDITMVLFGWGMLAWFGAALALLIGALSYKVHTVERVWHIITYLMFPLSGAAFTVSSLPLEFQEFVLFFPMVHGVEIVRSGFFGSKFTPQYSIEYIATFNAIVTILGYSATRIIAREVIPE